MNKYNPPPVTPPATRERPHRGMSLTEYRRRKVYSEAKIKEMDREAAEHQRKAEADPNFRGRGGSP